MAYDLGTYGAEITISDDKFTKSLKNAEGQISKTEEESKRFGKSLGSMMSGTLVKFGVAVAGAFAIDKIKEFGFSLVEAGSQSQAMNAQFKQVFGSISNDAQKTVNDLGNAFGMTTNRIKPAMSQMTSMFKGLGLDTKDAMAQAKNAVTLTADAAAFYDKSFEDASSALNSFIKGNYEGGESIGLFANETQLASWASKNLGLDWKKLNEAGKQTARLKFAEAMQKAAGATGQARRESNSYENQLGNLKQTWTDLKAKLAKPIMNTVINGLKNVASWVQKVDTQKILNGFSTVGGFLRSVFVPVIKDVVSGFKLLWNGFTNIGGLQMAKGLFEGFKNVLSWIRDNTSVVTALLGGLAGAFVAFKVITGINTAIKTYNILMTAMKAGTLATTLAQYGLNTALLTSPLTWVVVGIGAVIAAVILMAKHWDSVTNFLKKTWNLIKDTAVNVFNGIVDFFKKWGPTILIALTGPIGWLVALIVKNWDTIKSVTTNVFTSIWNFLKSIWDKTVGYIIGKASSIWQSVKSTFSNIIDFLKGIDLLEIGKNIIQGLINGISSMANAVWDKIKSIANGIKNGIKNALGIHSPSTEMIWVGQMLGQGLANGIVSMKDLVSKATDNLANVAIPSFSVNPLNTVNPQSILQSSGRSVQNKPQVISSPISSDAHYNFNNLTIKANNLTEFLNDIHFLTSTRRT